MSTLDMVIAAISATAAFGLTAMSLIDAFKTLPQGGVSRIGFPFVEKALDPLKDPLERAMGAGWKQVILAHWINGRPRVEQIGIIRAMVRLGLNADTAETLATFGGVNGVVLTVAAKRLADGEPLDETQINAIGRVESAVEARLDGAFDLADQAYRNWSRVLAGLVSVILAIAVWWVLSTSALKEGPIQAFIDQPVSFWAAVLVGVFAVPIAPIAKDLVSALTAASKAIQSTRGP